MTECAGCHEEIMMSDDEDSMDEFSLELYDRPFDKKSWTAHFCSGECWDDWNGGDFCYNECPRCERLVCFRNPNNGYDGNFTKLIYDEGEEDDDEEMVCNACFEEYVLAHGQSVRVFCGEFIISNSIIDVEAPNDSAFEEHGFFPLRSFTDKDEHDAVARHLIALGAKVISHRECSPYIGGFRSTLFVNVDKLISAAAVALFALKGRLFGGSVPCGRDVCSLLGNALLERKKEWLVEFAKSYGIVEPDEQKRKSKRVKI